MTSFMSFYFQGSGIEIGTEEIVVTETGTLIETEVI